MKSNIRIHEDTTSFFNEFDDIMPPFKIKNGLNHWSHFQALNLFFDISCKQPIIFRIMTGKSIFIERLMEEWNSTSLTPDKTIACQILVSLFLTGGWCKLRIQGSSLTYCFSNLIHQLFPYFHIILWGWIQNDSVP